MNFIESKEFEGCAACPLYEDGIVVYDEMPPPVGWSGLSLIGEMPGRLEVREKTVFVGASGKLLRQIFEMMEIGIPHVTNCIRCGLRQGHKPTAANMKKAAECCRPLVLHNLKELGTKTVCCLGSTSLQSMIGVKGIEKYRGCCWEPTEDQPWTTTCSIHPAGLLHQDKRRIWVELLRDDLKKADDLAKGEVALWDPNIRDAGDFHDLMMFLSNVQARKLPMAVDVETDSIDALTANLRTIGLAADGKSFSLPWPEWYPRFWEPTEWTKVLRSVTRIFNDPKATLIFQNKIYDLPVLTQEKYFGEIKAQKEDTLLLHHAVYPKLPHNLQSIASQFLAVPAWKTEFDLGETGWKKNPKESREETEALLWYNAADALTTLEIYDILRAQLAPTNVTQVYECDKEMVDIAIDWYKRGILIDMEAVDAMKLEYTNDACTGLLDELDIKIKEMAGIDFNPNSPKQLAKFLFQDLALPPTSVTPKGQPSTSKNELLKLHDKHEFIPLLIAWRKHSKMYSTYIKNLHKKMHEDGRLHSIGNITATPSGRFGFKPAVQNWPSDKSKSRVNMRKLMIAPLGYVYVGADYNALELRLFALLAGEKRLIEMFNDGVNVHLEHAKAFFGAAFENADDDGKDILRTRGKSVTFGKNYGEGPQALFMQIREDRMDEDPRDLLREVTHMSGVLDSMYPMMVAARDYYMEEANRNFNLRTFKLKRLRKFPMGGASITVCTNHCVQGGASDLVNEGTMRWIRELKEAGAYWNTVYPTVQTHDFLAAEVKEGHEHKEAERLEKCLYSEVTYKSPVSGSKNTMKFPAEAKIGHSVAEI